MNECIEKAPKAVIRHFVIGTNSRVARQSEPRCHSPPRNRHPLSFLACRSFASALIVTFYSSFTARVSIVYSVLLRPATAALFNTNEGPSSPELFSTMANPTHRGRIIPIVTMSRQNSPACPPSEAQPAKPVKKPRQSPSEHSSSSRTTRSRTAQTNSLELSSLSERGLYALPTEGDGKFLPLSAFCPHWFLQLGWYHHILCRTVFLTSELQETASTMPYPINCTATLPMPMQSVRVLQTTLLQTKTIS